MSTPSHLEHHALVNTVADRYRLEGYDVVVEPAPNLVPFDLGGYRPDLIVKKGNTFTLVEVKTKAQQLSFDQLRSLAEEVGRHEGWRFVLITNQDVAPEVPAGDDDFSWQEVEQRVQAAERLADLGERDASFLILWIAVERMLRHQARTVALPVDRLAPAVLIRQLYSQGELSNPQFETALRCQDVRNRLVHGFRAPDLDDSSTALAHLAHELIAQWSAPKSED
jgi:hypothetical protein